MATNVKTIFFMFILFLKFVILFVNVVTWIVILFSGSLTHDMRKGLKHRRELWVKSKLKTMNKYE